MLLLADRMLVVLVYPTFKVVFDTKLCTMNDEAILKSP
jgi:hypothetical protein